MFYSPSILFAGSQSNAFWKRGHVELIKRLIVVGMWTILIVATPIHIFFSFFGARQVAGEYVILAVSVVFAEYENTKLLFLFVWRFYFFLFRWT